MNPWLKNYHNKLTSAQKALQALRSGDGVYIHSNAAAPQTLIAAMTERKNELHNVQIYQLITLGAAPYAQIDCKDAFYVHTMFIGPNTRQAVNEGRADYTPIFFSELPKLFASRILPIDVCLISVSPPDANGKMTLGVSLDSTLAAMKNARCVIAEVNSQMPRSCGKTTIELDQIDFLVESHCPLPLLRSNSPSNVEMTIGRHVASLIEDGATLQVGIGALPNAVLLSCSDKQDLGLHTEMFSDGIIDLVQKNVITNARKTTATGKIAVSFAMGSKRLYDFIDNNEMLEFYPSQWINDPFVIMQNYKMTAINSALQIDVTGQICADSLGTELYSGCGGQVDFIRGASRSNNGKAIIALESTAKNGTISRIVPMLSPGAGVVTTRADVHFVVTEYGIANLHGKNLKARAKALIEIAHPNFRDTLEKECYKLKWLGHNLTTVK